MKKIVSTFILLILATSQTVFAIEESFGKYFIYKKETHTYVFKELDKSSVDNLQGEELEEYKIAFKLNKLYLKDKHLKIINKKPNFIPSLYALYYKSYEEKNYSSAIDYLDKIGKSGQDFSKTRLNLMYFRTYYKMGDFNGALKYESVINQDKRVIPYIADCYLNIANYPNTITYAKKVLPNDDNYYLAQTLLFKAYYRQNKISEAKAYANNLIKLQPEAYENYVRLALCETNKNQKLKQYYKARKFAPNDAQKSLVNIDIVQLEQEKIDNAVKRITTFVEKPDWEEIREGVRYSDNAYWYDRQDSFFKATNNCINKYVGNELGKCFCSIVEKQKDLNKSLMQRLQEERDRAYQEAIIKQNEVMIRQQAIQSFTNSMNQIQRNQQLQNINNNLQWQNFHLQNINNGIRGF